MKIAILSDIHGNLEAFKAVIDDIEKRGPGRVINLGDLIGYGPNPEEIIGLFRSKGYISVLGNHEAALSNRRMRDWLNFQARENSIRTEKLLSAESLEFCSTLPESMQIDNAMFVHGFPPSSLLRYVSMTADSDLTAFFQQSAHDISFVGHTHELLLISWNGKELHKQLLDKTVFQLEHGHKYIINAGSVGQPRDGTNKAKYLLWDERTYRLEVIHIEYDVHTTIRKIEERGFPAAYGYRLK